MELDGGQQKLANGIARHQKRDAWFAIKRIAILRFWNSDITENMDGVLERISMVANELSQMPTLPDTDPSLF
jgi:very-short-patch-repair endonuclease